MEEEGVSQSLEDWYTAGQAAKVLSDHSQRNVQPDYVRALARKGKIRTRKMGERSTLYWRMDVDTYIVEDRGTKAAIAAKARHEQPQ